LLPFLILIDKALGLSDLVFESLTSRLLALPRLVKAMSARSEKMLLEISDQIGDHSDEASHNEGPHDCRSVLGREWRKRCFFG
jgi:hypothetical protein